jgi:hypothetical protein
MNYDPLWDLVHGLLRWFFCGTESVGRMCLLWNRVSLTDAVFLWNRVSWTDVFFFVESSHLDGCGFFVESVSWIDVSFWEF